MSDPEKKKNYDTYGDEDLQGGGFNTGKWDSVKVRGWLDEIGVEKRFLAFEGDQVVHFNRNGINLIQPAPAE